MGPTWGPLLDLTTTSRQAATTAAGLHSTSPVCYPHVPTGPPSLMPISTPLAPSHPSFIKMEDRKRSAGEDLAPPTKRQAVNGKASADADMPWATDLEEYQKDAIYRRMLEYKREAATFQSQVKELQKRATDHDDHLRVADQWWTQLLDEVTLLAQDLVPEVDNDASFPTALNFKGSEDFQSHLASKARDIKSKLQIIFTRLASARGEQSPDIEELQGKLTKLLASQREYVVKFDRLRTERDQLEERLESASLRCIKAEKKYDRARSSAVAKLEQQAINGSGNSAGSGIGNVENGDTEMTNGISEVNEASQTAYKEASAIVEKQKEQLEAIAAENKTLTEQLTLATTRFSNLTEDDYARTDLFKQFRAQHEDVIRRINHLEATNIQLREDAESTRQNELLSAHKSRENQKSSQVKLKASFNESRRTSPEFELPEMNYLPTNLFEKLARTAIAHPILISRTSWQAGMNELLLSSVKSSVSRHPSTSNPAN